MVALTLTRPVSLLPNKYLKPHKDRIEKLLFYNNRVNSVIYTKESILYNVTEMPTLFGISHQGEA